MREKIKQKILIWVVAVLTSKEFATTVKTLVEKLIFSDMRGEEKRKVVAENAKKIAQQYGDSFSDNLVNLAIEAMVYIVKTQIRGKQ